MPIKRHHTDRKPHLLFILQYFYPDVTGFSQMLGDLSGYLADSNRYDCTVLAGSTARSAESWKRLPDRLGQVRIKRIRTFGAGKKTLLHRLVEYSAFYLGVVVHLLTRRDYDLVVCFTTPPLIAFAATVGMSFSRVPFIYYVQDLYPELLYDMRYVRSPWLMRKLTLFNRLILRRATRVVTIGKWTAKKLEHNYSIPAASIPIVENWTTGIHFAPPPKSDDLVILYSGNVGLAHDFSLLPQILNSLKDLTNVRFRFVGSGRRYEAVRKLFLRHPSIDASFEGYVQREDLDELLASAHVFLVAQAEYTVGDILPSKFYSYLCAGRPLLYLGTRKSEIGETVVKNDIGAVVEWQDDIQPAVDTLRRFSHQDESYLQTCERAHRVYEEHMGFERSANRFSSLVDEVLRK